MEIQFSRAGGAKCSSPWKFSLILPPQWFSEDSQEATAFLRDPWELPPASTLQTCGESSVEQSETVFWIQHLATCSNCHIWMMSSLSLASVFPGGHYQSQNHEGRGLWERGECRWKCPCLADSRLTRCLFPSNHVLILFLLFHACSKCFNDRKWLRAFLCVFPLQTIMNLEL